MRNFEYLKPEKGDKKTIVLIIVIIGLPLFMLGIINASKGMIEKNDNAFFQKANQSRNFLSCFNIMDDEFKNSCMINIALETRNLSICEHIVSVKKKIKNRPIYDISIYASISREIIINQTDECRQKIINLLKEDAIKNDNYEGCGGNEECIYTIATLKNDSSFCSLLNNKKDNCLKEIGKATKDLDLCRKINSSDERKDCFLFFSSLNKSDSQLCNLIPEKNQKDCLYDVAVNTSNYLLCNLSSKQSQCYLTIAKATNNSMLCFRTENLLTECWNYFALLHQEEAFCALIPEPENCYYELAKLKNDSNLCNQTKTKINSCLSSIAYNTRNPELCFGLKISDVACPSEEYGSFNECSYMNSDAISSCIYFSTKYSSLYCNYISKDYFRQKCYRNVGVETSDSSKCDFAGDFKSNCYFEIAIRNQNKSLCMQAGPWANECIAKLKNITSK